MRLLLDLAALVAATIIVALLVFEIDQTDRLEKENAELRSELAEAPMVVDSIGVIIGYQFDFVPCYILEEDINR